MIKINPEDVWVIIPAYNEERMIPSVLNQLERRGYKTIVVDDGSSDETSEVSRLAGAYVLRHAVNTGQGAALQTGITFALGHGAKYICTYDADGQHSPDDIRSLAESLPKADADIALGSRFLGQTKNMTGTKWMVLKAAVFFTSIHTGLKLTDTHNGLRLMTAHAAKMIKLQQPRMAHASEILATISKGRLKYVEVPVTISYTEYSNKKGQSLFDSLKILFDLLIVGRLK